MELINNQSDMVSENGSVSFGEQITKEEISLPLFVFYRISFLLFVQLLVLWYFIAHLTKHEEMAKYLGMYYLITLPLVVPFIFRIKNSILASRFIIFFVICLTSDILLLNGPFFDSGDGPFLFAFIIFPLMVTFILLPLFYIISLLFKYTFDKIIKKRIAVIIAAIFFIFILIISPLIFDSFKKHNPVDRSNLYWEGGSFH